MGERIVPSMDGGTNVENMAMLSGYKFSATMPWTWRDGPAAIVVAEGEPIGGPVAIVAEGEPIGGPVYADLQATSGETYANVDGVVWDASCLRCGSSIMTQQASDLRVVAWARAHECPTSGFVSEHVPELQAKLDARDVPDVDDLAAYMVKVFARKEPWPKVIRLTKERWDELRERFGSDADVSESHPGRLLGGGYKIVGVPLQIDDSVNGWEAES